MKSIRKVLIVAVALAPTPLFACATCFGKSDSPMAQGMNWGIFTLLGVIITVLATIAGFFIYLIRRESAPAKTVTAQNLSEVKV
jgi:heme/copper-type cytochrome/quinol oxidase subunit 2